MPDRDLRVRSGPTSSLRTSALAYRARSQVPWGKSAPRGRLPQRRASLRQPRRGPCHPCARRLLDLCLPLVKNCKTPGEAAQTSQTASRLRQNFKVRYSTRHRKKPHQSPKESIETGLASCTGLSILLADACRSVCRPRSPRRHSRCGPTIAAITPGSKFGKPRPALHRGLSRSIPKGLYRGWFAGDAAQGDRRTRGEHAIYAASFRKHRRELPARLGSATARRLRRERHRPLQHAQSEAQHSRPRSDPRPPGGAVLPFPSSSRTPSAAKSAGATRRARRRTPMTSSASSYRPARTPPASVRRDSEVHHARREEATRRGRCPVREAQRSSAGEGSEGLLRGQRPKQAAWKFDPSLDRLLTTKRPPSACSTSGRRTGPPRSTTRPKKDFEHDHVRLRETSQPLHGEEGRQEPGAGLAAVHRHARRRRRSQGSQRQPMENDADLLQRPARRRPATSTLLCGLPTTPGTASTTIMYRRWSST